MHSPEASLALIGGVSREYLVHHRVCPVRFEPDGRLLVAAAPNALLDDALDDLAFAYDCMVTVEDVSHADIERLIERLTTTAERTVELARIGGDDGPDDVTADVRDLANQPPVVRYVPSSLRA